MNYHPEIHHRRSIRLKYHDYSQNGAYFITVCIQNKICLLGHIENNEMIVNEAGKMINEQWRKLTNRFHHIFLDEYIVMPNHFHGIVVLHGETKNRYFRQKEINLRSPCYHNSYLSEIIRTFKSVTTHHYIQGVKNNSWTSFNGKLWQRNYHEHVIRNEISLQKLREYTKYNPCTWRNDSLFSKNMTF